MKAIQSDTSGSALVELVIGSVVACVVIGVASHLLWKCWNRCKCSYLAFQSAHYYLIGKKYDAKEVKLINRGKTVYAVAQCKQAKEEVELPFLENARW